MPSQLSNGSSLPRYRNSLKVICKSCKWPTSVSGKFQQETRCSGKYFFFVQLKKKMHSVTEQWTTASKFQERSSNTKNASELNLKLHHSGQENVQSVMKCQMLTNINRRMMKDTFCHVNHGLTARCSQPEPALGMLTYLLFYHTWSPSCPVIIWAAKEQ